MNTYVRKIQLFGCRSLVALFIGIFCIGCVGTKAGAYKLFASEVRDLIGHPYSEAKRYFDAWLLELKEIRVTKLVNGNELRDHFYVREVGLISRESIQCEVLTEVDGNGIVVAARAEGDGCWRPY